MSKSWLNSLTGKWSAHKKSAARRCRLLVEQLELREVPTVAIQSIMPPYGALEGGVTGGTLAFFTGSSTNVNDYSATVSWGDTSAPDTLTAANSGIVDNLNGTFSVVATHTYALAGSDTLTLTVNDNAGNSSTQTATVSVADASLVNGGSEIINGVPGTPLGATPITVATFTDYAAAPSDISATINWGDNSAVDTASVAAGTIVPVTNAPGLWTILGNHTYATTGAFQITVTTQDADSANLSITTPTIIANPSPLQVTPYDPTTPVSTLTNALVAPGTGLTITNASYVGQNGQAGTYSGFNFQDQNTSLSLNNGILLTSGSAVNALGPNNQSAATTAWANGTNTYGDPQLDALVTPDITYDANSLTLTFTAAPNVNSIQFQFVFASEEFPVYVGSYNDIFAAFLDGKQISFDPVGNPISVNSNYFLLNNSANAAYPTVTAGKTVVAYDIQYNGLTPALSTTATLDPTLTTHTLKFAIADTRDQVLDSGVFLTSLSGVSPGNGGTGTGQVGAPPLTLQPLTPPAAAENAPTTTQTLATFTDPGASLAGMKAVVSWGDGSPSDTYTGAAGGIVQNSDGSFSVVGSHTYAEEGQNLTFTVQVSDSFNTTVSTSISINVSDPAVAISGGLSLSFTPGVAQTGVTVATFVDPAGAEPVTDATGAHYTADIAWGDNSTSTGTVVYDSAANNFKVLGDHTYTANGNFTITVTVHHEAAADVTTTSNAKVGSVALGSVSIGNGPGGPNTLIVNGTAGDDVIDVVPHGKKGDVSVIINGVNQGVFAKGSFSSIAVYGLGGNDSLQVDGDVKATAYLFGGDGNDTLIGGGGPTFMDGGAGNDKLVGGDARGVLVGGAGADSLFGGDKSDLLIAGTTDADPAALLAVWTAAGKNYAQRTAATKAELAGHVFDDGSTDVLTGGDGMDLYYLSAGDVLHDKKKAEFAVVV